LIMWQREPTSYALYSVQVNKLNLSKFFVRFPTRNQVQKHSVPFQILTLTICNGCRWMLRRCLTRLISVKLYPCMKLWIFYWVRLRELKLFLYLKTSFQLLLLRSIESLLIHEGLAMLFSMIRDDISSRCIHSRSYLWQLNSYSIVPAVAVGWIIIVNWCRSITGTS
jgi:hypothetical protein